MKTFLSGLQTPTINTIYSNNGNTTVFGRAFQKTINSQLVIGPTLTQFIDVETTVSIAPQFASYNPNTGHLFFVSTTSAAPVVALYTFNNMNGQYAYVGKIVMNLPNSAATTYAFKGFTVYETGGNIYPLISATSSVAANQGTFCGWSLPLSAFTVGGTQIYAASGSGQQAVYFLQDSLLYGVNNLATSTWGLMLPQYSSNSLVNTKVWQWNGTMAAAQLLEWDLSITPTVANFVSAGSLTSQTTAYTNTSPAAYFTMGASNNGYNLLNGDPVVLTGTVPTAYTAWTPGTLQTTSNVYFLRDLQQQYLLTIPALPIQYTFTTSATSAAIVPGAQFTNNGVTFTVLVAYGSGVTTVVGQGASAPLASGTLTALGGQYAFTAAATTVGIGAGSTYTNNGQTFTAPISLNPGVTSFALNGTGAPTASGTLTLASGTGPATITFTAESSTVGPATITYSADAALSGITAAATYTYNNNGTSYTFTVPTAVAAAATSFTATILTGMPAPAVIGSVGLLTLASGTGPTSVSFTAATAQNWFYNLSATSGGAAVAPTSAVSTFSMQRAFGTSNNNFVIKSAPMATAFALGTIITNQAVGYAKPASTPANTALQGNDCFFMGSTTGLYMGLISDLSSNGYNFTITASTVSSGAVYMNNNQYFYVNSSITSGTTLNCLSTGAPTASGVLTKVSGTGPTTIAFSSIALQGATWASMNFAGVNITGTGIDIVAPTSIQSIYDNQGLALNTDKWIYTTGTSSFVVKPHQASVLTAEFGGQTNTYLETLNPVTVQTGVNAAPTLHAANGWLFVTEPTQVGQRGCIFMDLASDANFGLSGVISPVLSLPSGTIFKYLTTIEQLFNYTDSMNFWVRSASTSTAALFSSASIPAGSPTIAGTVVSGWTNLQEATDLSSISVGPFFQFCITFDIATLDANTPAQIYDLVYACLPPAEQSDYWAMDNDNTTQDGGTPSYVSWRLMTAYASSVPTLYARVFDTSGNLIFSANTSANPTLFQYSTNDGATWSNLGSIPNTVDVRVRVLINPTPAVVAQPSLRES